MTEAFKTIKATERPGWANRMFAETLSEVMAATDREREQEALRLKSAYLRRQSKTLQGEYVN